jgi:acyl carrier protein
MTKPEIRKKLSAILRRLAPLTLTESKTQQLSFSGESSVLPLDSVVVLQLVLAIEEEFGVTVEDADIGPETFGDLASLCTFVDSKLHAS